MNYQIFLICSMIFNVNLAFGDVLTELNLPSSHLPYYFYSYRRVLDEYCKQNRDYNLCVSIIHLHRIQFNSSNQVLFVVF